MTINIDRLMKDLEDLGKIGFIDGKGANRMAYSDAFVEGRDFVKKIMEDAGLVTSIDAVGNLTGYLPSTDDSQKIIALGSHIDTVPNGGIFDGALGVITAIEMVRCLKEEGYVNSHPVEIIAFNEEEGNIVGGTFGSKAFAGCPFEESMREPMKKHNITEDDFVSCKRNGDNYLAYLEYHIEQGGILESKDKKIGVVEGIFGIQRYRTTIKGASNHAGSTPMYLRNDALEKTSRLITDVMDTVRSTNDTMVCTVGTLKVLPGAVNVIPGEVEIIIELRDKDMDDMYKVIQDIKNRWEEKGVSIERFILQPETNCNSKLKELLQQTSDELDLESMKIYSGAGHDAINTSMIIPSALLFIPSRNGLSHHMDEYSSKEDILSGAEVMLETFKKIDRGDFNED